MSEQITYPKTLQEAIVYFANPDNALRFFVEMRWPAGVTCPHCSAQKVSFLSTRRIWKCLECKKQFSAKVGTVMEDSALGLDKWLACIWIVVNAKNGVSSYEIHRALGVKQQTAWFMLQRVRFALEVRSFEKFSGFVEADETFIGGKEKNKHAKKRLGVHGGVGGKEIVMGLLERHTKKVRTVHLKDRKKPTVQAQVRANVEEGSTLLTDTLKSYEGMEEYTHEAINHLEAYVRGNVHTNNLENYWALFKRCFGGTWTHLSDDHLHRYLVEQEYRFNNRELKDGGRFIGACMQATGKRLTYKKLTGKEE